MKAIFIAVACLGVAGAAFAHDAPPPAFETVRSQTIAGKADAFIATLNDEQRSAALFSLDDEAARTSWSNLPTAMAPRQGIAAHKLSDAQRIALHDLLASALSSQGYHKTAHIMWHEDVLRDMMQPVFDATPDDDPRKELFRNVLESYTSDEFYISIFDEPGADQWGLTFTGHHLGLNFSFVDGKIGFAPLFLGANPLVVQAGKYAGWRTLHHEGAKALSLAASLDAGQRESAIIAPEADSELFTGKGSKLADDAALGISAAKLNKAQKAMLMALIGEYLANASDEAAARHLRQIQKDGVKALFFAWWGSPDDADGRFMYRIAGPSILIEYIRESDNQGGFNHVHAIMRDPANDYGADWLGRHYDEAHQN